MKKLILIIPILIFCFSSCMTQKKQQRIAHSYFSMHPDELSKICSNNFSFETIKYLPGKVTTKTDTVTKKVIVTADCPDGSKIPVDCPPKETITIDNSRVDTVQVLTTEAKAKISSLIYEAEKMTVYIQRVNEDLKDSRQIAQNRLFIIIAVGALGVAAFFIGRKF